MSADGQGPLQLGSKLVVASGKERWLVQAIKQLDDVEAAAPSLHKEARPAGCICSEAYGVGPEQCGKHGAALHKEGAGGALSIESFTQGVLFAANFLEREADANFMPNEPAKVLLKGMASALRINMKASGFAAASPAGRAEQPEAK